MIFYHILHAVPFCLEIHIFLKADQLAALLIFPSLDLMDFDSITDVGLWSKLTGSTSARKRLALTQERRRETSKMPW